MNNRLWIKYSSLVSLLGPKPFIAQPCKGEYLKKRNSRARESCWYFFCRPYSPSEASWHFCYSQWEAFWLSFQLLPCISHLLNWLQCNQVTLAALCCLLLSSSDGNDSRGPVLWTGVQSRWESSAQNHLYSVPSFWIVHISVDCWQLFLLCTRFAFRDNRLFWIVS